MKINKSIITMLAIIITASNIVQAQKKDKKEVADILPFENLNDSIKAQLGNALTNYYQIMDALVASDESVAAKSAKAFRRTLEMVDMKRMTTEQRAFYMPLQKKLDYDAEHIQGANIEHMREHFTTFSNNMFALVKTFKANNGTNVFLVHCPMYDKGANWISSEAAIKNPYFGNQMLTCGKVTETIK